MKLCGSINVWTERNGLLSLFRTNDYGIDETIGSSGFVSARMAMLIFETEAIRIRLRAEECKA